MCGVVGVFGTDEAAKVAYAALWHLQHRGSESAGIASSDQGRILSIIKKGNLSQVFKDEETLESLTGRLAVGHVRYSTSGDKSSSEGDRQPICYPSKAIAHNGNFTNGPSMREKLISIGRLLRTPGSDTEPVLHLVSSSKEKTLEGKFIDALNQMSGAYSFTAIWDDKLVVGRDPFGYRPLAIGRNGASHIIASEQKALEMVEATGIREINPGELIIVDDSGVNSYEIGKVSRRQQCIFEHVYFARPDTKIFGSEHEVAITRILQGRNLAINDDVEADIVVPVPDSGVYPALGYARERGLEYTLGLSRSHNAGRTFIIPTQEGRIKGVSLKLTAIPELFREKRIILVDDSIVRGTTSKRIVKMVRDAGATEVHVRSSSPRVEGPCFYGIDTPIKSELIASKKSDEEIRKYIGADSILFNTVDNLMASVTNSQDYCNACFTLDYANNLGDFAGNV